MDWLCCCRLRRSGDAVERPVEKMEGEASVAGQGEFTLELHKAVVKGKERENAVLSPLSVSLALAMVAAGAKGPTLAQIAKSIKLPEGEPMHKFSSQVRTSVLADGSGAGGPQLALANRAWVDQSVKLKPQFQNVLKESYGSEAASVDFISKVFYQTHLVAVQCHIPLFSVQWHFPLFIESIGFQFTVSGSFGESERMGERSDTRED